MTTLRTGHETSFLTQPVAPEVVGPERLKEVEQRITEEKTSLDQVNAKAQEIEKEVGRLKASAPPPPNVTADAQHELLLADVELGKAKVDDLIAFDRKAHDSKKKYDATMKGINEKVKPLEDTVAGLRRRSGIITRTIDALVAESRRLWVAYLTDCAERDGAGYRELGEAAFRAMIRVVNLGSIIHRIKLLDDSNARNTIGLGCRDFCIPTLGTESTAIPAEKKTALGVDSNLFSIITDENLAKFAGPASESAMFVEFEKAGLKCPYSPPPPAAPRKAPEPERTKIPPPAWRPSDGLRAADGSRLPIAAITEE